MAETKITYGSDVALAVTEWDATLAAGEFATSAIFDNTSTNYMDVLIGGVVESAGAGVAAGDTFDIYISGQYSETATDITGGIDAAFTAATEHTEDVEFVLANLIPVTSVAVEGAAPTTAQGYHWGPIAVGQFFGGAMPKRFMLTLHNNTAGAGAAGTDVNTTGITYTTA